MIAEDRILQFVIALAIGFVVGVERGWRERDAPSGSRTAGVRTYSLVGLLGAVAAAVAADLEAPSTVGLAFLAFAGVFGWFKSREAGRDNDFSVTGVVAAMLVFVLGALCVLGDPRSAAAGGVATAGLLASRDVLHRAIARMTWIELRSALLLLAMTVVILPLLPDRAIDPFDSVNPREIWLFTVLTAGISYVGYVAVKLVGPTRGVLIGGLAGALVSSTAVTVAFARRAAAGEPARALAGGAALACLVSPVRVAAITGLVAPPLLPHLVPPVAAGAAVFGLAAALLLRRGRPEPADPSGEARLSNPFDLGPILAFAVAFAVVAFVSGWLTGRIGSGGLYASSAVFGLFDVDVASLTAARLVGDRVPAAAAAVAILIALAVNALARVAYAAMAGPMRYAGPLAVATLAALSAAGAVLVASGGLP